MWLTIWILDFELNISSFRLFCDTESRKLYHNGRRYVQREQLRASQSNVQIYHEFSSSYRGYYFCRRKLRSSGGHEKWYELSYSLFSNYQNQKMETYLIQLISLKRFYFSFRTTPDPNIPDSGIWFKLQLDTKT